VVLDIGGVIGAAIVYVDGDLAGAEIEIRAAGAHGWDGTHTAVRPRLVGSGVVHAAVFESLVAGSYQLRVDERDRVVPLDVEGGAVTELRWPRRET
jgi:hypothetical protein